MHMKLFLIDGHALIFKMYYAFLGRPMINSKGVDTSILFGFTKYLIELIEREHPTHLGVCFDPPGGTFRNKLYPEYKANRGETPQLVIDALDPLTRMVRAMDIPVLMVPGYEADDVIGTVAKRLSSDELDVYMVTPDKDYGQLVGGHVFQYKPGKSGSDNEILDSRAVCEKWGISDTVQVIDILTICGDSSDNVPGVNGVGPVGASKLLSKYGSTDGIYAHLSDLTPRQRTLFEDALPHIALSRELVTICTEVPVETALDDLKLTISMNSELKSLMDEYEFFSFRKKIQSMSFSESRREEMTPDVKNPGIATESVAPENLKGSRIGLALQDSTLYVAAENGVASGPSGIFSSLLQDASVTKCCCGAKSLMGSLAGMGLTMNGPVEDVELMHYVINPERSHKLESLALSYLGIDIDQSGEQILQTGSLFDDVPAPDGSEKKLEAAVALKLAEMLRKELREAGMEALYDEIEAPLVAVLHRMERYGVMVDAASLDEFAAGLRKRMLESEAEVRRLADEPQLNVASPKQIGEVIFEKLKLDPKAKKNRNGSWPTDEQTLLDLAESNPIIDAILDYRGTRKLLSTYIEPLPSYISRADGRVHTTFNQALTATGRLSSSNPNLQNIPVRTEEGREIRKAFVPQKEGWVIMSADYSQIELRIMAHLCGDTHLCEAFRSGVDVHKATAAKIFRTPVEEVTSDQRRVAKTANFGIMYGISAFGLSQRLKCSISEAQQIIEDYFSSFPSIKGYIDTTVAKGRSDGFVSTLFGRRRYLPDLNLRNANLRALAERNAVNAPIQGSSADIIKLAMIAVDRRLREAGLQSRMVLQIHDELLLEVPEEEIGTVKTILTGEMEGVVKLSVPLTVECSYGKTWLEAH